MLLKKNEKPSVIITIALVAAGVIIVSIVFFNRANKGPDADDKPQDVISKTVEGIAKKRSDGLPDKDGVVQGQIVIKPTIDYKDLKKDSRLKNLMGSRKQQLGLDKSLDMIVNSDEIFTIGDIEVSMSDILKQAFLKQGDVFEEKIETSGEVRPQKIKQYGIYVVQPGDNIWNIHFNILREYYNTQGVSVAPKADEPVDRGLSSGVGKILKFSETMVIIYNLVERKVDTNIDLLEPLSKIIVYNMDEVFSLLKEINYQNIDRIQFDGKTIWIPSEN